MEEGGQQREKVKPLGFLKPFSLMKASGRFKAHQDALPRLPVPPLQQSLDHYLKALQPIVSEEEWAHTKQLVDEFQASGGVGERLQKGLERRARKTENWLSEWWLKTAYLQYRQPVVIYSSPGVMLPKQDFVDLQGQLRFAAKLIEGVLDFKVMIDNETLPVEYLGGKPLCMNQYYQILSSCRVPGPKQDTVSNFSKTKKPPTHITVVHNYQIRSLCSWRRSGTHPYRPTRSLWASSPPTTATPGPRHTTPSSKVPLGGRAGAAHPGLFPCWGPASTPPVGYPKSAGNKGMRRDRLRVHKDKVNRDSVRSIQKSIFTVCLDAPMPRVSEDVYRSHVAGQMLHGGGSRLNSGNRWFDKTLQFIVAEDGSCGLVYEHAAAEGPPIVTLLDYVIEYTKKPELVRSPMVPLPMPKKLRFNITPEIKSDIEKAKQNLSIMIQDLDITVMVFHHFGKDFPKSEKLSPDAFIQMALQLAYYRIYGQACATYESASLRMFHLGRTDTIRSASMDSLAFVKAMDDSSVTEHQKVELLRKAVQAHRGYTDRAIRGEAFDRHLLGLKLQAIEDLVSMPDIFMDTSYAIAMHFHLSTSQVPAKTDCVMFFGPVVPDGYGVCYNPMEAHINFSLSAYNSCAETNAARLAHYLEKALLDMRALLQSHPRAKL
ncbi:carnitine O-acetyltransferase isoform X1 [Gorilla gorilla gorilla]|uniref:carnitine O-acetyltransferase isoform X1 n=2 Tax=Gorilla gorilla gorilla TaxID=9595 RepID=UPI003009285A